MKESGIVKWFDAEKGYGFIARNGKPDLFVHHSDIMMEGYRALEAGQTVRYYEGTSVRTSKVVAQEVEISG